MFKKLAVAAASLIVAAASFAQTTAPEPAAKPTIDARQANQEQRITQGVQSGRLTEAEAARLQKGEARIDSAQARAAADGTVTKKEQRHLEEMAQKESRQIHKQKHDRQNDKNHDGQRDHRPAGQIKK